MELFLKDMEIGRFCAKFPEWASLANDLRAMLPNGYRDYLVDLVVMDCEPGMKTCRDTRWHFDGEYGGDNKYVLWVDGPNRTEFLEDDLDFADVPQDREMQNRFLEEKLVGRNTREIPEGQPFLYDSQTPHRGVLCSKYGRRRFLRIMATNKIRPKNIVKRGGNVPFRSAV